jgi:hypothetical protein
MTRINPKTGKVEVYFPVHHSGTARADIELVYSVEQYLLLAHVSGSLEALRAKLIMEAERRTTPRKRKAVA